MLSEVQATSNQGSLLTLSLGDISSGIYIRSIEGLDPVKATIVSTSYPSQTGDQYQSSKRETRDIILHLGLEPDYVSESPREVRQRLYEFFMPRTWVDLQFTDSSGLITSITGMTESFDSDFFVQEPFADIVVRCFASDFVDPESVFDSFPSVSNTVMTPVDYIGTVETGITLHVFVNRTISGFTMYHTFPNGRLHQMDIAYPLVSGDSVKVVCEPGEKSITLTRGGVSSSILYAKSSQTDWIEFWPGANAYRVYIPGASINCIMTYFNRYGGL